MERPGLRINMEEEKLLIIGTINVKHIETNEVYLKEPLNTCDILAIHEHWLFLFQLGNIENSFVSHYAYSKAVDDNDPLPTNPKTQRPLRSLYVVP